MFLGFLVTRYLVASSSPINIHQYSIGLEVSFLRGSAVIFGPLGLPANKSKNENVEKSILATEKNAIIYLTCILLHKNRHKFYYDAVHKTSIILKKPGD